MQKIPRFLPGVYHLFHKVNHLGQLVASFFFFTGSAIKHILGKQMVPGSIPSTSSLKVFKGKML